MHMLDIPYLPVISSDEVLIIDFLVKTDLGDIDRIVRVDRSMEEKRVYDVYLKGAKTPILVDINRDEVTPYYKR